MNVKRGRPEGTPTPRILGDLSLPAERHAPDVVWWLARIVLRLLAIIVLSVLALVVLFLVGLGIQTIYSSYTPGAGP